MKPIIKVLLLMLIIEILCQCKKEPEPEPEPEHTFYDGHFLNELIKIGVDADGDRIISAAEAEAITFLDLSGDSISDMRGIELFVNLHTLVCDNNLIRSLDVSNNTELIYLNCENNRLTTLNVSMNTALEYLFCNNNKLTTLNVSDNISLESLNIYNMLSLNMVCVWTMPFPPAGVNVSTINSPNAYFTSDCGK